MHDPIRDASPVFANRRVDTETLEALEHYRAAAPAEIAARLRALEEEWDVECATEALATAGAIAALAIAPKRPRAAWAIAGLLAVRLVAGWRPLLPVVRALGFRSRREIEREFHALKALRGDHRRVELDPTAKGALTSAQGERGVEAKPLEVPGNGSTLTRTPVHGIPQYPIR